MNFLLFVGVFLLWTAAVAFLAFCTGHAAGYDRAERDRERYEAWKRRG